MPGASTVGASPILGNLETNRNQEIDRNAPSSFKLNLASKMKTAALVVAGLGALGVGIAVAVFSGLSAVPVYGSLFGAAIALFVAARANYRADVADVRLRNQEFRSGIKQFRAEQAERELDTNNKRILKLNNTISKLKEKVEVLQQQLGIKADDDASDDESESEEDDDPLHQLPLEIPEYKVRSTAADHDQFEVHPYSTDGED